MVIFNSDSNNTLVSLGEAVKRVSSLESLLQDDETGDLILRKTDIFLPEDSAGADHDELPAYITLPGSCVSVDECLRHVPSIAQARYELLSRPVVHYSDCSVERILYVGQGEVAHAVPSQCDVIVSDKATTCHILAFQSTSATNKVPLVSLTHLDGTAYDDCIRAMVLRHRNYHMSNNMASTAAEDSKVQLSIHIAGGFADSHNSSKDISNWLIHLLADIADEGKDWLHMTLRDCAITSMNDTGHCAPVARGLAVDMRTGEVFLAKCQDSTMGPVATLRSARISARSSTAQLTVIHDESSDRLIVEPFQYTPHPSLDVLLRQRDDMLLYYCSTSPDCEEDDFCDTLRATLKLMRDIPFQRFFGNSCERPLVFERMGCSNRWKQMHF